VRLIARLSICRSSFQTSSSILASNVQSLAEHLDRHSQLLNRIAVHPSPNYPGRTQEDLLGVLLRKKLEPQVQTWVEEGREIASGENAVTDRDQEMWSFAASFINERVQKYALEEAGANYTTAERNMGVENVRTGLRRKFEDEDTSDEDDEDEEMEDTVAPAKPTIPQVTVDPREEAKQRQADMLSMMRLATSGNPPPARHELQFAR
jgi:mediator of RNA polymerase II transcription subunit 8